VKYNSRHLFAKTLLCGLVAGLIALSGCGDDNGGDDNNVQLTSKGLIQLDPNITSYNVEIGEVSIGSSLEYSIRVLNVGTAPLTASKVDFSYSAPASGDSHGAAFELLEAQTPMVIQASGSAEGETEGLIRVVFTRQSTFEGRKATMVIHSNSLENKKLTLSFTERQTQAVAAVTPNVLNFGVVAQGNVKERNISVTNTGAQNLIIDGFSLSGDADFTMHNGDESWPTSEQTLFKVTFPEPVVVEPNQVQNIKVTFSPQTPDPQAGEIVLYGNDGQGEHLVKLVANQSVPCVLLTPKSLNFGGKIVGTKSELPLQITSCGDAPLKISGIYLDEENPASDYTLILDGVVGIDPEKGIDPLAPLVLGVNETIEVLVQYVPDVISPLDADNKPIPDVGVVVLETNSFEPKIEVDIIGTGVDISCPVAIASVDEGEEVIPQTTLHLKGDASYSPVSGVSVKLWLWSVQQPVGSASNFIPSSTFTNPVFEVNAAGLYTFQLIVTDTTNTDSCEPAILPIIVIPDEAIHVELLWDTPSDTDSTDEGEGNGTDLDLHFAHPFGNGPDLDLDGVGDPWFDTTFDCFWFNKEPNWGTFSPDVDDNPSLDRDDIDGWGPENLNINIPEEGATYRIGIHYWDAHSFGETIATVKVYIYGELETTISDVPMNEHDMWFAAEIPWLGGTSKTKVLTDDQGAYLITPNYQNPFFLSPQ
jgi:hypothetical protein